MRERWQFWDILWQRVRQCASIQTCAKRCWQPAHRALATDMLTRQVVHIGGPMWLIREIPTLLRLCRLSQRNQCKVSRGKLFRRLWQHPPRCLARHLVCSRAAAENGSSSVAGTSLAMGRVLHTSRRRRLIQSKASRRCNKLFGQNQRLLPNQRKRTIGNP